MRDAVYGRSFIDPDIEARVQEVRTKDEQSPMALLEPNEQAVARLAAAVAGGDEVFEDFHEVGLFAAAAGRALGQGRTGFTPLVVTIGPIPRDVREYFTLGYGLELSTAADTRMPDVASVLELPADLRAWCHFGIGGLLQRAAAHIGGLLEKAGVQG